jgi:hypothetical protein
VILTRPKIFIFDSVALQIDTSQPANFEVLDCFNNKAIREFNARENLYVRSVSEKSVYDTVCLSLVEGFFQDTGISEKNLVRLIRPSIITLTNVFFDRLGRILCYELRSGEPISISEITRCPISTREEFMELSARDPKFNQSLVSYLLSQMHYHVEGHVKVKINPERSQTTLRRGINRSFTIPGTSVKGAVYSFFAKAVRRVHILASRFVPRRIVTSGLGFYDVYFYFLGNWWRTFITYSRVSSEEIESTKHCPDKRKRLEIFLNDALLKQADKFYQPLLGKSDSVPRDMLVAAYAAFLSEFFPSCFLESLQYNFRKAVSRLPNKVNVFFAHSIGSTDNLLLAAAAAEQGATIVGVQDGAHGGYTANKNYSSEIEHSTCDSFITWGWADPRSVFGTHKYVPLKNPRYSCIERSSPSVSCSDLRNLRILYCPNVLYRYPCGVMQGHSRLDFADLALEDLEILASTCASLGIKEITVKPYDLLDRYYFKTTGMLSRINKSCSIKLLENSDKGIGTEVADRFDVIIWDQIGTGTVEQYLAGRSNVVFWRKHYSKPSKSFESLHRQMVEQSLICENEDQLRRALEKFEGSEGRESLEEFGSGSIRQFLESFGQAGSAWCEEWILFLRREGRRGAK